MANNERKPYTRMTEEMRRAIRRDFLDGKSKTILARYYGVGETNVGYAAESNSMEEYYQLQRASRKSVVNAKSNGIEQGIDLVKLAKDVDNIKEDTWALRVIQNNIYDLLKKYLEV